MRAGHCKVCGFLVLLWDGYLADHAGKGSKCPGSGCLPVEADKP